MDAPLPLDARAELADLRRRAYGPDADIHADPAALARLRELEEKERVAAEATATAPASAAAAADDAGAAAADATAAPAAASTPASGAPASAASGTATMPASDPGIASGAWERAATGQKTPDDAPPAARSWWRRLPLWVLLVAAGLVGIAIGAGLPRLFTAPPAATLSPVDIDEVGGEFLGADGLEFFGLDEDSLVPYEEYGDSRPWAGVNSSGARCIFIAVNGQWMDGGCTPAGLPPTAEYVAYDEAAAVRSGLPIGSVVRYVQRQDGQIEVWEAPAAPSDS
ncbi:hypothetical protein [Microbacterium terricola]|uniref:Uncharacterized protein n=1 Tax=Microbacterium terricola TaxID=344163 RepID=A0ABM8DZ62_9MICO|nr:hypothetical protein [Microbacterium terricola]UYK41323.1 hypothetical protein OAU46_06750 [Microbacterium terricola]BDV30894.1 hypothetical protein Microterr_15540 [Microbacterium terricola]